MAQVTRWDYMYLYGRMAADAAHRFTVYGLIFATGMHAHGKSIAGAIDVYGEACSNNLLQAVSAFSLYSR